MEKEKDTLGGSFGWARGALGGACSAQDITLLTFGAIKVSWWSDRSLGKPPGRL